MHITNIKFTQVKGRNGDYDVTPATLVIGPNRTGKTAIADAVRVTLLGYHPDLARKNPAILELSAGSSLSAALTLSTGVQLTRSYQLERNSVKMTSNIDPLNFATPLLDATEYFQMTANERVDYIFGKVQLPPDYTPDGVIAALHRVSFGEDHSEELQTAKSDFIVICEEVFEETNSVAEALARLGSDTLKNAFTIWNKRSADTQGAIRVMTELKLRESECSATTLTDLENEMSRLQGLLSEANAEMGRLTEQRRQAHATAQRRGEIVNALQEPAPEPRAFDQPAWEDPRPALEAKIKDLDKIIAEIGYLPTGTEAVLQEANRVALSLSGPVEHEQRRIKQIEADIAEINAKPCCPFCEGKAKGWQKRVVAKMESELEPLVRAQKERAPALKAADENYDLAVKTHAEYQKAAERRSSLLREKSVASDQILSASRNASARENMERDTREANQRAKTAYEQRQRSLAEEQSRLVAVDAPPQSEIDAAAATLERLTAEYRAAGGKRDAGRKLQQQLIDAEAAATEHRLAAAKVAVIKAFGAEVKSIKAKMVTAAFAALLTTANLIFGEILTTPLAYHEGELGYWGPKGNFVKHATFSGIEEALSYVALATGLSATAPFKLAVVDELGRLTPSLQRRTLELLARAVETGALDQVIAIIPMDADKIEAEEDMPDGWSVIVTGSEVEK